LRLERVGRHAVRKRRRPDQNLMVRIVINEENEVPATACSGVKPVHANRETLRGRNRNRVILNHYLILLDESTRRLNAVYPAREAFRGSLVVVRQVNENACLFVNRNISAQSENNFLHHSIDKKRLLPSHLAAFNVARDSERPGRGHGRREEGHGRAREEHVGGGGVVN
jgi:hypothetical protein